MVLQWAGVRQKKNLALRKHDRNWSIPKKYRQQYYLPDGLVVDLRLRAASLDNRFSVALSSGGEFRLPAEMAREVVVRELALDDVEGEVWM